MMSTILRKISQTTCAAMILLSSHLANAGLIVVDNGTTLTASWDEDVTLIRDMDVLGIVHAIVFEDVFADNFTFGVPTNGTYNINASVNGGSTITLNAWAGWNYRVSGDSLGNGWDNTSLAVLWHPDALDNAELGDSVRLFGSLTIDKVGQFQLPDFAATTVDFNPYNQPTFSGILPVTTGPQEIPEPPLLALFALGLLLIACQRIQRQKSSKWMI